MTENEARYVIAHREMYPDDMYHRALETIEAIERQRR
jgi:hypothetical protein